MDDDFRSLALCLLVPLGALACAMPFAEAGFVDDFSYIHMAKSLAETGHFAYNGWPTAMLGVQVWWGAAWVWLCGFSFTLVRMSVLPFAVGAIALVYLLARRARLSPHDALFAALLTGLSTVFLPLAPTFMSDVPAFFCLLASLYGFVRAADAAEADLGGSWPAIGWLAAGTLAGVLGGTIRQTVWFAPIVCNAVLVARSGGMALRLAAVLGGTVGMAAMVLGTAWFARQPYAIPTRLPTVAVLAETALSAVGADAVKVIAETLQKIVPAVLFCLPWVLARDAEALRSRWGRLTATAAAAAMVTVAAGTLTGACEPLCATLGGWWRPIGNVAYDAGVAVVRCGVLGLLAALVMAAAVAVSRRDAAAGLRLPAAVVMPLAYLVPYGCSLLLVSRTTAGIFPRYYLPFLPALTLGLLFCTRPRAADRGRGESRSVLGWLLVAFFAARAVAIAHDEFADTRCRLAAIAHLERQGVPRDRIVSKWGIDGWEQIERQGHLNDSRIRVPPDAYRADLPRLYPDPEFSDRFPALVPEYIVAEEREALPGEIVGSPRFPYVAWLRRPYRRVIVIRSQAAGEASREPTDGVSP